MLKIAEAIKVRLI